MVRILLVLFLLPFSLLAARYGTEDALFGGTFLAYSGLSYKPGMVSVQPYLIPTRVNGIYDKDSKFIRNKKVHQYTLFVTFQAGLIQNLDGQVSIVGSYTHSNQGNTYLMGDTLALLGFQITEQAKEGWPVDMRLLVGESFPTGKFEGLDINLDGIDISGSGAYETFFIYAIARTFHPKCLRTNILNLNLYYIVANKAEVRDVSIYGGEPGTSGSVTPGKQFIMNLAWQYSLSYHWAFGIDCNYAYQASSLFHRNDDHVGGTLEGLFSSGVMTLAPGLQYTLDDKFGIGAGAWLTLFGRNRTSFQSGYFTFYYFF